MRTQHHAVSENEIPDLGLAFWVSHWSPVTGFGLGVL